MRKKLLFIFVLSLGLLWLLSACTGGAEVPATLAPEATSSTGAGSIWVLLPDSASSARWETDDRRFFEDAFNTAGVSFNIVNAEGDARTQQTQAEQAITAGAKVILLVNLDSGSGAAIIAAAGGEAIPAAWTDQLAVGGRIVAPMVTAGGTQALVVVERTERGFVQKLLEAVHFVPLKSGIA